MATSVVTFDKASEAVGQEISKRNRKIVESIPSIISKTAKQTQIFIFNVGPKAHSRNLGSLGNFYVPACEEGQDVSQPLVLDGIILERIPDGASMNKMTNRYEEGMMVAHDILFIGRGYDPSLNRENLGLFISESPNPTTREKKLAREKYRGYCQKKVDEADILENQNKRDQITEMHRDAAKYLGVTKVWLSEAPKESEVCPACDKLVKVGSVKCGNCNAVLDWEKAKIYFPQEYLAHQQAIK